MKTSDALFKTYKTAVQLSYDIWYWWYMVIDTKCRITNIPQVQDEILLYSTSTWPWYFSIHVYVYIYIYLVLHLWVISMLCILLFHYMGQKNTCTFLFNLSLILILWSDLKSFYSHFWKSPVKVFVWQYIYLSQFFFQTFYWKHWYFFIPWSHFNIMTFNSTFCNLLQNESNFSMASF